MRLPLPLGAIALAALATTQNAAATTRYHLVDLGPFSYSSDINNQGEIAGDVADAARGSPDAALYSGGAWRTRSDGRADSWADAIDDAGNMVGEMQGSGYLYKLMYYPRGSKASLIPLPEGGDVGESFPPVGLSPDGRQVAGTYRGDFSISEHCFAWHPGEAASVDIGLPPNHASCDALDVNDAGQIVGQAWSHADMRYSGFIYKDGTFTLAEPDPHAVEKFTAINGLGHAIGLDAKSRGPVYWDGQSLHLIPKTGDVEMDEAFGINGRDEIVGNGRAGSKRTIVKFADGVLVDLVPMIANRAHWHFAGLRSGPTGINDRGEISGNAVYVDDAGRTHDRGYLLVPND